MKSEQDNNDGTVPLVHFRKSSSPGSDQQAGEYEAYTLPHPVWSQEELHSVQITHTPPEKTVDKVYTCTAIVSATSSQQWSFHHEGSLLLSSAVEDNV